MGKKKKVSLQIKSNRTGHGQQLVYTLPPSQGPFPLAPRAAKSPLTARAPSMRDHLSACCPNCRKLYKMEVPRSFPSHPNSEGLGCSQEGDSCPTPTMLPSCSRGVLIRLESPGNLGQTPDE